MVLRGKTCLLRPYATVDAARLAHIASDPDVSRWMTRRFPYPYTHADAAAWTRQAAAERPFHNFAIEVDGVLAGGMGMTLLGDLHAGGAEFGYWLGKQFWGRGIATEAVALFEEYAFSMPGLRRLQAGVCAPNIASTRVLEKNGFVREGVLRAGAVDRQDRPHDLIVFGKLSPSFRGRPSGIASEVSIRMAAAHEAETVARFRVKMHEENATSPLDSAFVDATKEWVRERTSSGTMHSWFAESPGGIVGVASVQILETNPRVGSNHRREPHVHTLYVEPPFRGRGVGHALMEVVMAWCKAQDYDRVTLRATAMGRPLYTRLGFVADSQMVYRFKTP